MNLYLIGHSYKYAAEQIMLSMFPFERPEYPERDDGGDGARISLSRGETFTTAFCRLRQDGESYTGSSRVRTAELKGKLATDRLLQKAVKLAFYRAALKCRGKKPVWGSLTGIRPGKIVTGYLESGMTPEAAKRRFEREYDVSPERARLCLDTAAAGLKIKNSLAPEDICLYVGIPFCPTRCAYCSFVSHSVEKSMKLIPRFLDALFLEIDAAARAVRENGLRPVSLYMGGGTPTTLSAGELDSLCSKLAEAFDLGALREYTVEAGRPDTITPEKLAVLRAHGATRISVNPQSMRDEVLEAIGRRHSAQDIIDAMAMVRECGSFAVNMDLIAGLPADSASGFSETLDAVLALAPENITVHTLSIKRGSHLKYDATPIPPAEEVGAMLDEADLRLRQRGWAPYYLYRQKFMSGGFENVGWALDGYVNLYNVCIMEEYRSIISLGGGASTKLVWPEIGRIERIFNPKYPQEYIERIDKVCGDKLGIKL